jgi:hypothetical protein
VVCAQAPSERAPEIANVRTAHFPRNRLFITHLFARDCYVIPREVLLNEKATTMPMEMDWAGITLVFSVWKNSDFQDRKAKSNKLADCGQDWWFSATWATLSHRELIIILA